MDGGVGEVVGHCEQVSDSEWGFSLCGGAVVAFGSGESSVDKCGFSVVADVGKVWFGRPEWVQPHGCGQSC